MSWLHFIGVVFVAYLIIIPLSFVLLLIGLVCHNVGIVLLLTDKLCGYFIRQLDLLVRKI